MTCSESARIQSTDLGAHLLPHQEGACEAGPLKQSPSFHVRLAEKEKLMVMHRQTLMQVQSPFFLFFIIIFYSLFFIILEDMVQHHYIHSAPNGLKGGVSGRDGYPNFTRYRTSDHILSLKQHLYQPCFVFTRGRKPFFSRW